MKQVNRCLVPYLKRTYFFSLCNITILRRKTQITLRLTDSREVLQPSYINNKERIQFCLSVNAKPELKLTRNQSGSRMPSDGKDFYVLGNSYEFKCEISGNPEPHHVKWIICDHLGNI